MKPIRSLLLISGILIALSASQLDAALAETATAVKPIGVGKTVPSVTLKTADGTSFDLLKAAQRQPSVIIFYRGGWCPYCNRHLAEFQTAEKQLEELGYQILAISPDAPESLAVTAKKQKLGYTLVSDAEMAATDGFGLGFKLDAETVEKYQRYGIKLSAKRGNDYWLPVPAVYIADRSGKIAFAHWDPDYKQRLSLPDLLKAAKAAAQ